MRWWILAAALVLATVIVADKLFGPSLSMFAQRNEPARTDAVVCPKEPGLLAGPFVAKAETARAIFETVAQGLRGDAFMKPYDIDIEEQRDHWVVFQSLKPEPDACGVGPPDATTCSITAGGGGLAMHIDKCTGAISHAHYAR